MTKIAVIFHSVTGSTKQLAESVVEGIASVDGAEALSLEIVGADIIEGRFRNKEFINSLQHVDGMIFGSPTYMGSVTAQFKAFADATGELWAERLWANKVAAGFTIGSNLSGDQLSSLQYMQIFANQHGMLWSSLDIPGNYDRENRNRLGAQSGLVAHSKDGNLDQSDLVTAHYLGMRVAKICAALGKKL